MYVQNTCKSVEIWRSSLQICGSLLALSEFALLSPKVAQGYPTLFLIEAGHKDWWWLFVTLSPSNAVKTCQNPRSNSLQETMNSRAIQLFLGALLLSDIRSWTSLYYTYCGIYLHMRVCVCMCLSEPCAPASYTAYIVIYLMLSVRSPRLNRSGATQSMPCGASWSLSVANF